MGSIRSRTIDPTMVGIVDVVSLERTVHFDHRGFLLETMRADDSRVQGDNFAMSYLSLTLPGQKRDSDRWHVHKRQVDRFVVVLGEMILALYDARPDSSTRGHLVTVRMAGAQDDPAFSPASRKERAVTYMITIPSGVYHCIGNLSSHPFLLQNYPTRLYDPQDEGRVPFVEVPIGDLGNRPFSWDCVEVIRP